MLDASRCVSAPERMVVFPPGSHKTYCFGARWHLAMFSSPSGVHRKDSLMCQPVLMSSVPAQLLEGAAAHCPSLIVQSRRSHCRGGHLGVLCRSSTKVESLPDDMAAHDLASAPRA